MSPSDADYAAGLVARRLGLPAKAALTAPGRLLLSPLEIHENDGFSLEFHTGWRTAELSFHSGKFARPLIEKMGQADHSSRLSFCSLAKAAAKLGKLTFRVNSNDVDPDATATWPEHWQKLELSLKRQGLVFEELRDDDMKQMLSEMIPPIFGMCIVLIGIEDFEADDSALEGRDIEQASLRYERKPLNREICLSLRGRRCYCCNTDFGAVYGPNADGFIEVHHTTPVSEMVPSYKINPLTELVPICSNCHSVVHLTKPAASVDAVKALFATAR